MILHKVFKYLVLLLGVVAMGFFFYTLSVGDEAIEGNIDGAQAATVSPLMTITYIVLGIIVAAVVLFVFKGLFSSVEVLKKSLVSIGIFVVVCLVSYFALADNSIVDPYTGKDTMMDGGELLSAGTSQLIGASLWVFYILAIAAVGSIAWAGVSKAIKK